VAIALHLHNRSGMWPAPRSNLGHIAPSQENQNMPDQYRRRIEEDRRNDNRGFQDRGGDEHRPWFSDEEARARRGNDERQDRYPYGGERDRSSQAQGNGGDSREQRPWRIDERENRGQQQSGRYGEGGRYGSSSYDRGSYGRSNERDWPRREDERAWNRGAAYEGESGRGGWGYEAENQSRWMHGREPERFGRASFGGHGTGFESYSGRGPKDYKRSDDRIREEISDRLTDDHHVDATEVSVVVQGGEVTLTGTVASRDQKRRAEDLAESISGVREVTNNLRVSRQDQPHGLQNPLGLAASANAETSGGGGQHPTQSGASTSVKGNRSTSS
jgi:osmotically-inducible protein OsmY